MSNPPRQGGGPWPPPGGQPGWVPQPQPPRESPSAVKPTLVVIGVLVGLVVLVVAALKIVPGLKAVKKDPDLFAIEAHIKQFCASEFVYMDKHGTYADIDTLREAGLLSDKWSEGGRIYTYEFSSVIGPDGSSFELYADPSAESTGTRHYFMDESCVIRVAEKRQASASDRPLSGTLPFGLDEPGK